MDPKLIWAPTLTSHDPNPPFPIEDTPAGDASGDSDASGDGERVLVGAGSADGDSVASGGGASVVEGDGTAEGDAEADAASILGGDGAAEGDSEAEGAGSVVIDIAGTAEGDAECSAVPIFDTGAGFAEGDTLAAAFSEPQPMAFLLAQAGTTLYKVDVTTGVATALTLPSGVTLSATRKPKFALLNQWVAMVNSPTINLLIDPEGVVTPMVPQAPTHGPSVAAGGGSGLTGEYLYRVSFIVKNSDGDLLAESPLSPPSASVTLSNEDAALTDLATSSDDYVTGRRLYRTLNGGDAVTMFHILDIDDNTTTALNENTADDTVTLLPVMIQTLVSPPGTRPGIRFKNICQWKSRFWAVADDPFLVDTVYVCDTVKVYAWPTSIIAYPTGQTKDGVIAFAPRKNELGFLKTSGVWAVQGSSGSTGIGTSNISVKQVDGSGKKGCIAEDSVVVVGDAAYWLGRNAVYEWTDNGIEDISSERVKPWFNSDTHFNRARFQYAFGRYNEVTNSYELHLAAIGSSVEDRWVSFNLTNRRWYGPHKTGAFTPTHAGWFVDANSLPIVLVGGSNGTIYTGNSSNKRDGSATAIDMDCYGPWHTGGDPDKMHTWLQLSMLSRIEAAGTLEITPYLGGLDAAAGTPITHTLTTGRELLSRLGVGRLARLRIRKNTVNQSATLYGYELPFFQNGRR